VHTVRVSLFFRTTGSLLCLMITKYLEQLGQNVGASMAGLLDVYLVTKEPIYNGGNTDEPEGLHCTGISSVQCHYPISCTRILYGTYIFHQSNSCIKFKQRIPYKVSTYITTLTDYKAHLTHLTQVQLQVIICTVSEVK